MCWAGPRSQAEGMNTNTLNPEAPVTDTSSGTGRPPLRRPFEDRMLGGVAAGIARYLGVDPAVIRIAFVVLTLVGGGGIALYLAGLLLIPDEGSDQSMARSVVESFRSR
jgi:phage shock protein PspC (stress-responsive transcriptional regulator)